MNEGQEPEKEYKDFIEIEQELVMKTNSKQAKLVDEYILILRNLGTRGPMTVKEIHELYWEEKKKKHGKTLKTIYRYMDLLEKEKIVKVAGHRKPKGSHLTEKLYSRAAMVFFEEEAKDTKYWRNEEGMKQMEIIWKVSKKYFGLEEEKMKDYANIIDKYFVEREKTFREVFELIEEDKELAEELKGISIMDFKSILSIVSMTKAYSKKGTVREKLDKVI